VASLYTEFSDRSALAPNLVKILLVAERKGGDDFSSRRPISIQSKISTERSNDAIVV
jgi:hypothetical protein